MNITLTGASGFVGTRLIQRLQAERHELHVLGRKPVPGVKFSAWNSQESEPPPESLASADAIVHLTGEPVAQRWTPEAKQRIRTSRIDGTRHLVHALSTQSRRPRVLVSASAIGIYGSRGDEILTEKSSPGEGFLENLCVAWEAEADLAESLGIRVVKIRIGVVLGNHGGALSKMLPMFRLGAGGRLSSGKQWMSWVHIDDLVNLILFAIQNQNLTGPANGTSPKPVTNTEFTEELAQALHRPALLTVPKFALKLMYGEMAEMLLGSQRVLPEAAQAAGYRFEFPTLALALAELFL